MGNRGVLHDADQHIRKDFANKRWIICRLEFKGRRRQIMQPGQYTELFFLDEATALAAGHRPCAECQRQRFNEFRLAWMAGSDDLGRQEKPIGAEDLDKALHPERIGPDGTKPTYRSICSDLPDGVFVAGVGSEGDEEPHLLWEGQLWAWRPGGYEETGFRAADQTVDVLTPRSTVNALAEGFLPAVAL